MTSHPHTSQWWNEEQVDMQQFIHSVRLVWSWRLALQTQATDYLDAGLQKYACPLTTDELINTSGKYILASICICVWDSEFS
jgi:hypothetical protein